MIIRLLNLSHISNLVLFSARYPVLPSPQAVHYVQFFDLHLLYTPFHCQWRLYASLPDSERVSHRSQCEHALFLPIKHQSPPSFLPSLPYFLIRLPVGLTWAVRLSCNFYFVEFLKLSLGNSVDF